MNITFINSDNSFVISNLHIHGISTGFISSLGPKFLTCLYKAISRHDKSFCLIAEENNNILGFVAFTEDLKSLYKLALKKYSLSFIFAVGMKLLSPKIIKRITQNLFYPSKSEKLNLPKAELLSIAVAPQAQGRGLATQLVQAGFEECKKRGIDKVKVLVAAENQPANKLYQKCGFDLAAQVDSHGILSNIYVKKLSAVCDAKAKDYK